MNHTDDTLEPPKEATRPSMHDDNHFNQSSNDTPVLGIFLQGIATGSMICLAAVLLKHGDTPLIEACASFLVLLSCVNVFFVFLYIRKRRAVKG